MRFAVLTILLAALSLPAANDAARKSFRSPDRRYTALILPTAKSPQENAVQIRGAGGRPVFYRDFSSPDGQHGFGVERAQWTPDSKFFVFSLVSSGGHSAQNYPTMFYSIDRKLFCTLGDYFEDSTPDPEFKISAPAKVTIQLLHTKAQTVDLNLLRNCPGGRKKK